MGGQNQNVNITVNTRPNNTQVEINTGRESHKLKTKKNHKKDKTYWTRAGNQKQARPKEQEMGNRKQELDQVTCTHNFFYFIYLFNLYLTRQYH